MTIASVDLAWLKGLQLARARHCLRCPAIPVAAAAEEGTALAESLGEAIEDGTLTIMEPNVLLRDMEAGRLWNDRC